MTSFPGFPADTIRFLKDLANSNNRDWFAENKNRYENSFLSPALDLIRSMEKPLARAAPLLTVEAKKMGGSLMRIYRDTRFAKDKTPYKTNIGIHFRHRAGKDVHAPGIYLHIAADECFLGAGIWRPASDAIKSIRQHIDSNPESWKRIAKNKRFNTNFTLYDDRLKSVPRGYGKSHPMIDALRLKSFLGMAPLSRKMVQSSELITVIPQLVKRAKPLMTFLCEALNQPY